MPTIIGTSTVISAASTSNQRKLDRTSNGVLWSFLVTKDSSGVYYYVTYCSTDNGVTWVGAQIFVSGVGAPYVGNGSFFIDKDDYAHLVVKHADNGRLYYFRGTPNTGRTVYTWSTALQLTGSADYNYPDIIAHREGTGWKAHIVASYADGAGNGVSYFRQNITSGGVISQDTAVGLDPGGNGYNQPNNPTWPSIDFNHTGDGKTVAGSTPHLYAAWSAGASGGALGIRFRKATYSAGVWTWGTDRAIETAYYVLNQSPQPSGWLNCLFDGTSVIINGYLYNGTDSYVKSFERDAADTTTTQLVSQLLSSGTFLGYGSSSYDGQRNIYFFGDNLNGNLGYRKWTRANTTLSNNTVSSTKSNNSGNVIVRRGYGNNKVEWIYIDGVSSPYDIKYDYLTLAINISLSRTYKWNVKVPVSLTRTYKWNVRVVVTPFTRVYKWNVRIGISLTRTYKWNVIFTLLITRAYLWNVRVIVPIVTRIFKWNVRVPSEVFTRTYIWEVYAVWTKINANADLWTQINENDADWTPELVNSTVWR